MLSQLRTPVSPCSLNEGMLHSSLIINCTVAVAMGKSSCLWVVFFYLKLFFVMRKVLSQQFLTDQHAQIVEFFSILQF